MKDKEALNVILQAVDHAAYAGAFAQLRPEVRAQIQAAVEVLKAPEPEQEGADDGMV